MMGANLLACNMVEVYLTNAVPFTSCQATLQHTGATTVISTKVVYFFWAVRWSLEPWTYAWP